MDSFKGKETMNRKPQEAHPFLQGNFAPVEKENDLTPCLIEGKIPECLTGGQYIRNGGNPIPELEQSRAAHWFDGDGMLAGVYFLRTPSGEVSPHFVNRFVETDIYLNSKNKSWLTRPLIPSIATLISPTTTLLTVLFEILRALALVILSWIQALFSSTKTGIFKLSVANTSIFFHNSRALAACESGPPIVIKLPSLETVSWWTGKEEDRSGKSQGWAKGHGLIKHLREYTTAHPKLDPMTGELLLYHMCFIPPFLRVSIIQSDAAKGQRNLLGETVPGFHQPKLMHDFGVSRTRTAILDFPLSLDPLNLLQGKPIVSYDPESLPRIGIFPRMDPSLVKWVTLDEACLVFHVANTWDDPSNLISSSIRPKAPGLNLLACRLNSATLVYAAGNVIPPLKALPAEGIEKCQLYYWRFSKFMNSYRLDYEFSLSSIPFEFPTLSPSFSMSSARFIYGTSTRSQVFHAGRHVNAAAKIDCLVKVDVKSLIARGKGLWDSGKLKKGENVDDRNVVEILTDQARRDDESEEALVDLSLQGEVTSSTPQARTSEEDIKIFSLPTGWFAQEAVFVPRKPEGEEDDGYLLFYVFDEGTFLDPITGHVKPNSTSELWILEAKEMKTVVAKIKLPSRVPYGLHGTFVSENQILSQKSEVVESRSRGKVLGM